MGREPVQGPELAECGVFEQRVQHAVDEPLDAALGERELRGDPEALEVAFEQVSAEQ